MHLQLISTMTYKEYLTKSLSSFEITDDDIDIILFKANLNKDDEADVRKADNAIYNRLTIVLKNMTQNISEGGYSISWNMDAVKLYYAQLCSELGKPNLLEKRPKVRNKSNVW